nr:hypothetical protein [Tanacetum cinerariifolium]
MDSSMEHSGGIVEQPPATIEENVLILSDNEKIEEVNVNCILMANLQQASTSGTQTDKALGYDSDGPAE